MDRLFIENYASSCRAMYAITYRPHMAYSRSDEEVGMPGTCTASCQLRIKMLQGPGLCEACPAKRSHWRKLFQVILSLTLTATTDEIPSVAKPRFGEVDAGTA